MFKDKVNKKIIVFSLMIMLAASFTVLEVLAAPNSGYLRVQETTSEPSSPFSTVAYIFTLVITFVAVIGLAYFTSRFLGQKIGRFNNSGDTRILSTIPLGANRAIHAIQIAGKFLIIGVTDHHISLLQEISDAEVINKMNAQINTQPAETFDNLFQRQLASLKTMRQNYPAVFGINYGELQNEEEKRSK